MMWRWFFFLLLLLQSPQGFAKKVVIPGDERTDYFTEVLTKALSYSPDKQYQLAFFSSDVPKVRAFRLIAKNEGIDVIAAGTTKQRDEQLMPVRIPLLKGLYGWRVPIVLKNSKVFSDTSFEHFRNLSAGLLFSWSDTAIMKSNGLNVVTGSDYLALYTMLEKRRFDYLPLAVIEAERELEKLNQTQFVIDPQTMIHYPTAYFFYLNKENHELAKDIAKGLEIAMADGSFDRLFMQYYGHVIARYTQNKRTVYRLSNPFLPAQTPLKRASLWLDLSKRM